ncbi:Ig-like domain-containing protein [Streptomyces sp. NPDC058289]|uniref:Ig-like domain-containing protein n=1 Tax=Streptomyces sp. NPDC058289 TaxID=3346425 RepID=UPI0036EA79AA
MPGIRETAGPKALAAGTCGAVHGPGDRQGWADARFPRPRTPRRPGGRRHDAHGSTVGIGQPVSLVFKGQKVDPALRAGIEGRVEIKTSTGVVGAWHWAEAKGDTYLHFRPREYWPAGTKVTLDARLAGVKLDARTAATGNRELAFTVGPAKVSKVDLAAHTLTMYEQPSVGDVIEVTGTTGKPMDRFGNGYGDWNLSWDEWLEGSALGAFKA